ncbi:peptidoglycan-binding domain-containing protein [Streptomyces sp. NPDC005209]|uniref:peptidoglycan-binding domain-containing protein n=1 Tax=Streptomyces sp. NPDC005209 TaxID=3156715 RepID=UPI0033B609D0
MKRALACLGALTAITAGLVISGPSAQAASECSTTTKYYDTHGYYTDVPTVGLRGTNFCTLRRGASNNAVYTLQVTLDYCYGKDTGGFDGVFGAKTESALKQVQSSLHLTADGVYGPNTRDAMEWQWRAMNGSQLCDKLSVRGPLRDA